MAEEDSKSLLAVLSSFLTLKTQSGKIQQAEATTTVAGTSHSSAAASEAQAISTVAGVGFKQSLGVVTHNSSGSHELIDFMSVLFIFGF